MEFLLSLLQENTGVIITGILGIGVVSIFVDKITRAMKEASELLAVTALALSDKKLTSEEVTNIKKEMNDVVNVFKNK